MALRIVLFPMNFSRMTVYVLIIDENKAQLWVLSGMVGTIGYY